MIPAKFAYSAPASVPEAVSLLQEHGWDAKLLAGGHSLIPMMKLRLAAPKVLIDLNRIPELQYIEESNGHLRIGAMTREADLETSDLVRSKYQILAETTRVIADPLVRNMATVGGNLAHADPANDHPATMLAVGAELVVTGPNGQRTIPVDDFFVDLFVTSMDADEILTEIRVPTPPARSGGAYVKLERKVGDFPTAAVAAQVTLDDDGAFEKIGIGLTNVGLTPIRAARSEDALRGEQPTNQAIREAAELAAADAEPESDLRGPADYKRDMIRILTMRALRRAVERAQQKGN